MRLRFTLAAAAELDEVLTAIGTQSPDGARNVLRRVQEVLRLLQEQPSAGRLTSRKSLRRIATVPYPYLIFYEVTPPNEIVVHGVRHGARKPSSMPDR